MEPQSNLVMGRGLGEPAGGRQGAAQVELRDGQVGPQLDRPLALRNAPSTWPAANRAAARWSLASAYSG